MKKLLLIWAFLIAVAAQAAPLYITPYTINKTYAAATSQTGFPWPVTITLNTGHVETHGYDVWWYSDSAHTTRVPAERTGYNNSTGVWTGWVLVTVPASSGSNAIYYHTNGDSTVSTDPNLDGTYGKTSVWPSPYLAVYHFLETSNNVAINDSTANANTTTSQTWTSTAPGSNAVFDRSAYMAFGGAVTPTLNLGTVHTISFWAKTSGNNFMVLTSSGLGNRVPQYDGSSHIVYQAGASNSVSWTPSPAISDNTWTFWALVRNGTSVDCYINGSKQVTTQTLGSNNTINSALYLFGSDGYQASGYNDEWQFQTTNRSGGWIADMYASMTNASFGTDGTEGSTSGGTTPASTLMLMGI